MYFGRRFLCVEEAPRSFTPGLAEPPLFLPVNVASPPLFGGTVAGPAIEIDLSNYVRLRLDCLPEPEWLCRITAGLASLLDKEVIS